METIKINENSNILFDGHISKEILEFLESFGLDDFILAQLVEYDYVLIGDGVISNQCNLSIDFDNVFDSELFSFIKVGISEMEVNFGLEIYNLPESSSSPEDVDINKTKHESIQEVEEIFNNMKTTVDVIGPIGQGC